MTFFTNKVFFFFNHYAYRMVCCLPFSLNVDQIWVFREGHCVVWSGSQIGRQIQMENSVHSESLTVLGIKILTTQANLEHLLLSNIKAEVSQSKNCANKRRSLRVVLISARDERASKVHLHVQDLKDTCRSSFFFFNNFQFNFQEIW